MERFISIISGGFLFLVVGFAWGWLALTFNIFPYTIIDSTVNEVVAFIEGGEGDGDLTVIEKLRSDMGGPPFRQLVNPTYKLSYNGCNGLGSKYEIDNDTCEMFISEETIKTNFSPGALMYGPYVDLRAGGYEAILNFSISAPLSEIVGSFDVVSIVNDETTVFHRGSIYGTAGKKKSLKFSFAIPQDMRLVEIRVFVEKPVVSVVRSLKVSRESYWLAEEFSDIKFTQKKVRRADPQIIKEQDVLFDDGLIFIFGAIDSEKSLHGAFFLNKHGEIVHTINIDDTEIVEKIKEYNKQHDEEYEYFPMEIRFPHGVAVLQDGSIIFNDGDAGNAIRRIDWCGNEIWSRLDRSNHSISIHNNLAWHWELGVIVATNIETGEVEKTINLSDIIFANSDIGVLKIRKNIKLNRYLEDPFHPNDVEPLTFDFIDEHPQFSENDLLISLRSLDMLAVLDPETLKIKWWRIGAVVRQHDPDWQPNGLITIFDNHMTEKDINGVSRIVSINPDNFVTKIMYSGEKHDVYTWMRGKHQVLQDGSILMTLTQQGRVVLVNADGSLIFDFHNKFDNKYNLLVSEAIYLPADYLDSDLINSICK